jgi:hypothetical protein
MGRKPAAKSRSRICICRGLNSTMRLVGQTSVCLPLYAQLDSDQAAVESTDSDDEPSSCERISRNVTINSSRETWLFLN